MVKHCGVRVRVRVSVSVRVRVSLVACLGRQLQSDSRVQLGVTTTSVGDYRTRARTLSDIQDPPPTLPTLKPLPRHTWERVRTGVRIGLRARVRVRVKFKEWCKKTLKI